MQREVILRIAASLLLRKTIGDEHQTAALLGTTDYYKQQDACGISYLRLQMFGKVLIAENLRDALWALEVLARHEKVDAKRLGCAGLSYGGRMTMLTMALARMKRAYKALDAEEKLQVDRFEGDHEWSGQIGFRELEKALA